MDISVIIPAYNEQDNIRELHEKVTGVMKKLGTLYLKLGVKNIKELEKAAKSDRNVRVIKFRRNFGQTAALDMGFRNAKGELVVTMDADLQNDPADIPKLISKINEGYDAVSGWRYNRKDSFSKRAFSVISRILRRIIIKGKFQDPVCSLKTYRRECLEDLEMDGEMHRYIVDILVLKGYKVAEVKINHFPRKKGKTKYGLLRLPKGFLDLLVVAFWQRYSNRPIHLFGGVGILSSFLGFLAGGYLVFRKFFYAEPIADRPLLLLSVLLVIIGIQFLIFGLIADILLKMYYSGKKRNYAVEKII